MGLLTTELAALACGVQPATIRDWRRRGLLAPVAGGPRNPMYALADVQQARMAPKARRVTESSRDHFAVA